MPGETPMTTDAAARAQSSEATQSGTGQVESGGFASRLISTDLVFSFNFEKVNLQKISDCFVLTFFGNLAILFLGRKELLTKM